MAVTQQRRRRRRVVLTVVLLAACALVVPPATRADAYGSDHTALVTDRWAQICYMPAAGSARLVDIRKAHPMKLAILARREG